MPCKLIASIDIEENREIIFDYTQDYDKRLEWDTFLTEAYLIDAKEADKNVKAWCVSKQNLGMETEYVSFNRPKVTAIKMTKGPKMFKSFAGTWKFDELEKNKTKVTFIYSFAFNFPYTIVAPFIHLTLHKNVKQRLADLKKCIET